MQFSVSRPASKVPDPILFHWGFNAFSHRLLGSPRFAFTIYTDTAQMKGDDQTEDMILSECADGAFGRHEEVRYRIFFEKDWLVIMNTVTEILLLCYSTINTLIIHTCTDNQQTICISINIILEASFSCLSFSNKLPIHIIRCSQQSSFPPRPFELEYPESAAHDMVIGK